MLLTIVAALNELLQMLPEPAVMLGIQKSSRRKLEPTHARVKCGPSDGAKVGEAAFENECNSDSSKVATKLVIIIIKQRLLGVLEARIKHFHKFWSFGFEQKRSRHVKCPHF